MRLCLVEDIAASGLEPLTLTRPVHELLLGATSLGSKLARAFGVGPGPQRRSCMIRSHLVAVQRYRDPHWIINDRDWMARGPVIVANSRWVPPADFRMPDQPGSWIGMCEGQPACALVGPEDAVSLEPQGVDSWFDRMTAQSRGRGRRRRMDCSPVGPGRKNGAYLERDFAESAAGACRTGT